MIVKAVLFVIVCGNDIGSCRTVRFAEYTNASECTADVQEMRLQKPIPGIVDYWCAAPSKWRKRHE